MPVTSLEWRLGPLQVTWLITFANSVVGYVTNVPSFMIDLQSLFQSPVFGYYSAHCMQIATLTSNGTVDLEATKRSSVTLITSRYDT